MRIIFLFLIIYSTTCICCKTSKTEIEEYHNYSFCFWENKFCVNSTEFALEEIPRITDSLFAQMNELNLYYLQIVVDGSKNAKKNAKLVYDEIELKSKESPKKRINMDFLGFSEFETNQDKYLLLPQCYLYYKLLD